MQAEQRITVTVSTPQLASTERSLAEMTREYEAVRAFSDYLCAPLEPEDMCLQSMPEASPVKWHLAHATWFFETFVLKAARPGYRPFSPNFEYMFNSYYNGVGPQYARPDRGKISRPTVQETLSYRAYVDEHMHSLLSQDGFPPELMPVLEIGLHHEQQHQELLVTDLKHPFSLNPLFPVYRPSKPANGHTVQPLRWASFDEGIYEIGHDGPGFSYDCETPRHKRYLHAFELADRLVTCGEYLAFMEDGAYTRHEHWLSDGFAAVKANGWRAPLYWYERDGEWLHYTLGGLRPVDHDEPVCHVSFYEAEAFARWSGKRLPTEAEWEVAAAQQGLPEGNFVEEDAFHPMPARDMAPANGIRQLFGDAWEWTRSAFEPYPGYQTLPGALGEYNGKFMCDQYVLRGGSCATSRSHIRATYRNFFPAAARWQFSGIRLAQDG